MHRRLARHLLSQSNTAFAKTATSQGQRNFAVAVTVSCDASEIKKGQKRVSKDERRSMVESFVNNYRAMNSGKFPTASIVRKEVGGSYYVIKNMVQELQHKSQMPSVATRNDTTYDGKLHENADAILGITDAIKNSKVATKEEDGPHSAIQEKTSLDEIANNHTMTSEITVSFKKDKMENLEEDGPDSTLNEETLPDVFAARTSGETVEVQVELTAQAADEQTLPLHYKNSSEEIAKLSGTDDSSAETADNRFLLKEDAKDSYSETRMSEDNIMEKTTKVDQQQQSSGLSNVTRDMPEEEEKKLFKWSLKSLADGFMRMWRRT